jgi:hypothetical protein
MKEFKLRASASGKMLTAKGVLAKNETSRGYVKEWLISEITGKRKTIDSKYLRRGVEVEDLSIKRIGKTLGLELTKNELYFENDFFTGTPDLITEDTVIDAKSSWNCFTFPYFMEEPPIDYVAQLQVYMNLTGKRKAILAYCLENGTQEQINQLAWQKAKEVGADEPTIEHWDEAESDLNYDHLPDYLRIKMFYIDYDESMIDNLKEVVLFARKYINEELLTQLNLEL